ncbi:MAG: tetratricopeptide repeat protein [Candidatus Kapabacteria bacterium]|nr:tetratricopeptide repeat protein [Candidatus Kapabacteria bacterium]
MKTTTATAIAVTIVGVVGMGSWTLSRMTISANIDAGKEKALQRASQRHADEESVARERKLTSLLATIEDSLVARPLDSMLVVSAANISYDLGKFEQASRYYRRFLDSIDPSATAVRVDYAYSLFQTGKQDDAIAELEAVIQKDPKNQSALFNIAVMYTQLRNMELAVQWFTRCQQADPSSEIGQRAAMALKELSKNT